MAPDTTLDVQPASYTHPCGDLLDGGRRREYLDIAIPLYRAIIEEDLEAAKVILQDHDYLVRYSITEKKEAPLHVAAAGQSTEFVSYLVSIMSKADMELQNGDGNTALCVAAITGNVGIVKIMVEENEALLNICGSKNMIPLDLAAFHGNLGVVNFLYDKRGKMTDDNWTNDIKDGVLLKCIQADLFDVALRILEDNIKLPQDKHAWDVLQVLARNRRVFREISCWFSISSYLLFSNLRKIRALEKSNATSLLRLLWKRIIEKPKDVIDDILRGPMIKKDNIETYPSQILFIAAKMNNAPFLVELIREYPDLIWKTNDDGESIFHISVAHRHLDTYSLLYEIGSVKDLISPIQDNQGNNILHIAAKKPEINDYDRNLVAAPFQILTEMSWYMKVRRILPPPCREVENNKGKTAEALFTEKHKNLLIEGVKSINKTINISMVVAALVCTIGYSVVFQVPGGFDQNSGFPILLKKKQFSKFISVDFSSFICSTLSIIIFLSITLSRHHGDPLILLQMWLLGQLLLLISMIFLFFAFAYSFAILYPSLYNKNLPFAMYETGGLIGFLCFGLYLSIYRDVIRAILMGGIFIGHNKHMFNRKKVKKSK